MLAVDEKSRASAKATLERMYPTEWEPPEAIHFVPEVAGNQKPHSLAGVIESLLAHASPTSFDTRETGTFVEVSVQPVPAEPQCWDLSLSLEEVRLVAME